MSEKALPARSIYGWDGTNWVKVKVDADGKVYITNTDLTTILAAVQHTTYGLSALKTLIDSIIAKTDLIPADIATQLDTNIPAVKAKTDLIPADIATQLDTNVPAIKAKTDLLFSGIATEDKQDTIIAKTGNLPSDPADESLLEAAFNRQVHHLDFWSDVDDVIAITAAADSDYDLPNVIVPTLPTGITIWKVVVLFKCALIRDSSGADNGIDEAGTIRVKKSTDADFDADGITAFDILDNMWLVDVTNVGRDRGGDVLVGNMNNDNISSKVTGAATYNLRLDSISADGANLELHEVQVGLRIYFY